jgi:septum formation protein
MIREYLDKEPSLHCAGAFQAEGLGITLVKKFAGDDFTTLIGLPLIRLTDMLQVMTHA